MTIPRPVIVLGAGASHGARVPGHRTPPLDGNFLAESGKIFSGLHQRGDNQARIEAWRDFKRQLAKAGLKFEEVRTWRLEQLSTFLEARGNLKGLQLYQGRPRDHAIALDKLKRIVAHVLLASGGQEVCPLHCQLIKSTKPSSVISFNYDLIADQSMLSLGVLNWKAAAYRGAQCAMIPTSTGTQRAFSITSSRNNNAIPLIKLHGSIHWEEVGHGKGYRLSGASLPSDGFDQFKVVHVPENPYLIPPVAAKIDIQKGPLRERWYSAVDHLYAAKAWIIWGYSFPVTDTISQVLFRTALARNKKKKPVFVINPDHSVAARVEEVCKKVSVRHFTSMEGFLYEMGILVPRQ
jgi:hypothetical protein